MELILALGLTGAGILISVLSIYLLIKKSRPKPFKLSRAEQIALETARLEAENRRLAQAYDAELDEKLSVLEPPTGFVRHSPTDPGCSCLNCTIKRKGEVFKLMMAVDRQAVVGEDSWEAEIARVHRNLERAILGQKIEQAQTSDEVIKLVQHNSAQISKMFTDGNDDRKKR